MQRFLNRIRRVDGFELEDLESDAPRDGYVLYWMTAARRPHYNLALDRAAHLARIHQRPLVILEALRAGHEFACARFHAFVAAGMRDHRAHFESRPVSYLPYLEPKPGAGKGLLAALASRAALIVTDDYPCFFLPRMLDAFAERTPCPLEAVDGNGIFPMHDADRHFTRAYSFRRHLQSRIPVRFRGGFRDALATPDALGDSLSIPGLESGALPDLSEWPLATDAQLRGELEGLEIDHSVGPVSLEGGFIAAEKKLKAFLEEGLASYGDGRNHPDDDASSGFSPYLHWGHLGAHAVFDAIAKHERWDESSLPGEDAKVSGKREGFWGMGEGAEAFLDQLITWREIGFNGCLTLENYKQFESLPEWALRTLREHEDDPRECYSLGTLEAAETSDEIWNAAQRQLVRDGVMHNYLRMLWGKKILEWSETPKLASERMIYLNDKYALDGRDPNSYSGIFWVLGRYDRAWGPERPIYGKIRYMTSDSTRRKLRLKKYLERFGAQEALF